MCALQCARSRGERTRAQYDEVCALFECDSLHDAPWLTPVPCVSVCVLYLDHQGQARLQRFAEAELLEGRAFHFDQAGLHLVFSRLSERFSRCHVGCAQVAAPGGSDVVAPKSQ